MKVEGCVINMPHKRNQEVTIARSETFPLMGQAPSYSCLQAVTYTGQLPKDMCNFLYRAALKGDWQLVKNIFQKYQGVATVPLLNQGMNALQVAVVANQTNFIKELLDCMTPKELEFQNHNGDTALALVAILGNVKIAEKMVKKNDKLPMIQNIQKFLPLHIAAMFRRRDMVLFLFSVTELDKLTSHDLLQLLIPTISGDMYDIAVEIISKAPTLATVEDEDGFVLLRQLANKPFAIGSRSQMSTWERRIGYWFKGVYHKALMRSSAHQLVETLWKEVLKLPREERRKQSSAIFHAAKLGNIELVTILIRADPDIIWIADENNRNIFHISILYRQESIFNLIHETDTFKDMIASKRDKNLNNMLHLAGELAPANRLNVVPGAAFQLQRELLWFKEVEKIMPLSFLNTKKSEGQTPKDLLRKTHENLRRDGERWMRDTATNCMIVATFIVPIGFAALLTVPGGYNQEKGTPIFLDRYWFKVFFIVDSIAFLSSLSSMLIFLSILTARYTVEDFLHSLPKRLVFGLTTLFISTAAMIVAFGSTCFLVYQRKMTMVPHVIIALGFIPISFFVLLHYKLFLDVFRSTFERRFLFRPCKLRLFKQVEYFQLFTV